MKKKIFILTCLCLFSLSSFVQCAEKRSRETKFTPDNADSAVSKNNISEEKLNNAQLADQKILMERIDELEHQLIAKEKVLQSEIDVVRKDLAENIHSLQHVLQTMNENTKIVSNFKITISDLEEQMKIKNESVLNEINAKLDAFSEKQIELFKEINEAANSRPTVSQKSSLIVSANTSHVSKDGRTGNLYIVKAGDVLSKIAEKFQVSVKDIIDCNDLRQSQNLKIGQELFIPKN